MFGSIIKRERVIVVRSTFCDVTSMQRGHAHESVTNHQWNGRPLVLCECQELRREVTTDIAVERDIVRDPKAVENREQQERVFGRLPQRVG